MELLRNKVKRFRLRCALTGTLLFICFGGQALGRAALPVYAEETNDLIREKEEGISKAKEERQQIQKNLTDVKAVKQSLDEQKNDLNQYITSLDAQVAQIELNIEALNESITVKEGEIAATQIELDAAIAVQEAQYEAMKQRIRYMYERGDHYYLELIFGALNYSDILNKAAYIEKLEEYDRKKLEEYEEQCRIVELTKTQLEEEKETLEETRNSLHQEEEALKEIREEKKKQLETIMAQIEEKQKAIAAYEASIAAANNEINALEAAIKAERARLAEANRPHYDGGMFRWPCPSTTYITDEYGWRVHPIFGDRRFHSGLDIGAGYGAAIVAAYRGTVVAAAYSSSMGNYIMIDHGDDLYTIYMHCSKLQVSTGQSVSAGQQIGLVGSTGNSTGPHLHFGVRKNGAYVSPWGYLGR